MNFFEKIQKLVPFLGESEISDFIQNHNWLENEDDEFIIIDYLHFHFKALADYNTNLASKILLMKDSKNNNNNFIKEESKEMLIEENKNPKKETFFLILQKIEEMSVFLNDDAEYLRHLEFIYGILSKIKENPNDAISREIRLLQSEFILYKFIIEIFNALAFQACELEEETLLFYSENTFEEWDSILIFIKEKIEELNKKNVGNDRVNNFLNRQKQTQNPFSNADNNIAQSTVQDQLKEYRQRMKEKFASPFQTQSQSQMMFSNVSSYGNGMIMNQTMSINNQGISFKNRMITLSDIENKRNIENVSLFAQRILQLTNEFRKSNGKSLLQYHNSLQEIGLVHSKNMGEGKVPFGHQGFNDRVQKFPFSHRGASENVAYCTTGYNDIPKTIVDGWINSPGHKKNLLSNSDVMGVGVYRATNGNWYFTQLFAKY